MYISCIKTNENFLLRRLDKNNSSICEKIPYYSNLFLETNSGNEYIGFKSNNPLKKFEFFNSKEYYEFKEKFKGRVYGDIDEVLQYLSKLKFDNSVMNLVNAWAIDIEVYSESEFPSPDKASKYPIVVISLINFSNNEIFTWVYDINKSCTLKSEENWKINIFDNEKNMFLNFLSFWKNNIKSIHILTGWNSNKYDIPYFINRINYTFTNSIDNISEQAKLLSPFKNIKLHKDNFNNEITYSIHGLPLLDYLELFKKFNFEAYPSYKLEEICQTELKIGKLNHSEYISFSDFYNKNINDYIKYNKKDVELIKQLDNKFKFILLAVNIAYNCKINFENIFSPIKCWESLIYNKLLESNIIIPPRKHQARQDYMGAYVKEPEKGLHSDIISFDLTSLYPSVIRAINISPETICENEFDNLSGIDEILKGYIPEKYHKENKIVDAAGNIFNKSNLGIFPLLMKELFIKRITSKKLMQSKQKELQNYKLMLKQIEN